MRNIIYQHSKQKKENKEKNGRNKVDILEIIEYSIDTHTQTQIHILCIHRTSTLGATWKLPSNRWSVKKN